MDSYKILRVNEDASDEEIYKAYIALKSNYSEEYNTSPYAKRKYREIEKAYLQIKDELSRKIYKNDIVEENKKYIEEELFDYDSYKREDRVDEYIPLPLEEKEKYNDINVTKNLNKKREVINVDVDYLYYALSIKYNFKFKEKIKCNYCQGIKKDCDCCNSIGKVNYGVDVIVCPNCNSEGYVEVYKCNHCNNVGFIDKEIEEEIYINDALLEYGIIKDDIRYQFNLLNSDKVNIEKNNIYVEYDLSYFESINGVDIRWNTLWGDIVLKESYSNLKKEYIFDLDKKVHLIINKISYKGENVHKYLFIKPSDLNKKIYLNTESLNYNYQRLGEYNKEVIIDDNNVVILEGLGLEGINNGDNGDLVLTPIITNTKLRNIDINEYSIQRRDTSLFTNLFGGRFEDGYNIGFKGKNSIVVDKKGKNIYILSGSKREKRRVSNYLLLSIFIYSLWFIMPLLIFVLPYTKIDLIVSCVLTIVYSIGANIVLNVKL